MTVKGEPLVLKKRDAKEERVAITYTLTGLNLPTKHLHVNND